MPEPTLDDLISYLGKVPFAELPAEFPALMTKAYELGRRTERARVVDAAAQISDALRSLKIDIDADKVTAPKTPTTKSVAASSPDRDYGDVIKTVGLIVDDRLEPGEPFNASDIAKKLRTEFPDEEIEMVQIHNAIRGLKRQGRIVRISRGEYVRANSYTVHIDRPAEQAESEPATSSQGDLPMKQDFMS